MTPRRGPRRLLRRLAALVAAVAVAVPSMVAPPSVVADRVVIGRVRASPVVVSFDLASSSIAVGQSVRVEARVTNVAITTLRMVSVELRADRTGLLVKNAATTIPQLKPGRVAIVTWNVCGVAAGTYVLLVRVSVDAASIDSAARLLTVTPGRKRCA